MANLSHITPANIRQSFNLPDLLKDSVFYPSSAVDANPIEILGRTYNSFVHVDYTHSKNKVRNCMLKDFNDVGYDLMGTISIERDMLLKPDYTPLIWERSMFEKVRFYRDIEHHRMKKHGFHLPFFALWSVYKINRQKTGNPDQKAQAFSILHIGGEACEWFELLYLANKINPTAMAILSPGDGYGDNWTRYLNTEDRMYKLLELNVQNNTASMPKIVLSDRATPSNPFPWKNYYHSQTHIGADFTGITYKWRDIYRYELMP